MPQRRSNSAAATAPARRPEGGEYSLEERRQLLRLAHEVILGALTSREVDTAPPTDHLAEPRGAFTTLHLKGQLRGCVGYVMPVHALYRTVAETAISAAFHDTRFMPVTKEEAAKLEIEISVLSRLQPIEPDDIEIGRHGLVVTFGSRRGLLLPQVPVEWGWDVKTFLQQTCQKAGLPADAWERGATLEGFTAEIFGDQDVK